MRDYRDQARLADLQLGRGRLRDGLLVVGQMRVADLPRLQASAPAQLLEEFVSQSPPVLYRIIVARADAAFQWARFRQEWVILDEDNSRPLLPYDRSSSQSRRDF